MSVPALVYTLKSTSCTQVGEYFYIPTVCRSALGSVLLDQQAVPVRLGGLQGGVELHVRSDGRQGLLLSHLPGGVRTIDPGDYIWAPRSFIEVPVNFVNMSSMALG